MTQRAMATLPCGLWINGIREQVAVLRPLTGVDELLLADKADQLPLARFATLLLSRCVERFGPLSPVDEKAMRDLPAGDRQALLLHVWRLTFGPRVKAVVSCPVPGCGGDIPLDLAIDDVLRLPYHDARPLYEATIEDGANQYVVLFRLPNGGDQEAAADALAATGEDAAAATAIVQRAVYEVRFPAGALADDLPAAVIERLPAIMADLDPQANPRVGARCPACGAESEHPFEITPLLLEELALDAMQVLRDVHVLASSYHWSERAILGLTAPRRRLYLRFIAESAQGTA